MDAGVEAKWIMLSVILILFLSFEDSRAGGIPSFCNIPPVKEGGNATVTCTFTDDIFVTKSDFEIDRYSSTNKQETLLVCTWIIDEPTCYQNPRIRFDRVITNTLQIQILNVTSVDAEKYICYVLPTPNGISKSCNLTLEETTFISETHAPGYQLPRSSELPMIDIWTTIQDSKEDGIMSASVMGILIAVIIALFILQGIFCVAVFIYFKRHFRGGPNDNDKEANKGQTRNIKKTTHEKKTTQYRSLSDINTQNMENENTSCVSKSTSVEEHPLSGTEQNKIQFDGRQQNEEILPRRAKSEILSYPDIGWANIQFDGRQQIEEILPRRAKSETLSYPGIGWTNIQFDGRQQIEEILPRRSKSEILSYPDIGWANIQFDGRQQNEEILPRRAKSEILSYPDIGWANCEYKRKMTIMEILPLRMRASSDEFLIASGNGPVMDINTQNMEKENTSCVSKSTSVEEYPLSGIEQNKDINTQNMENEITSCVSKSSSVEEYPLSGIEQNKSEFAHQGEKMEMSSLTMSTSYNDISIASTIVLRNQCFRVLDCF